MAAAKMETAAERYRRIAREKAQSEQLFDVECPSGMVFKCRRASMDVWVSLGIMPMNLVEKMTTAAEEGKLSNEEIFASLPIHEKLQSIDAAAKMLRYVCVEPRIVDAVKEPNDITQDEMLLEDINHIVAWASRGGDAAAGLESFRNE